MGRGRRGGKGFSFALIFFALADMAEGRWNRMWLLLGLATAFHALVGGWAGAGGRDLYGLLADRQRSHTAMVRLGSRLIAALAIASPGVVPPLLMNRGVDRGRRSPKPAQIYVFQRLPHHLDPLKMWNDGFVLPFVAMSAAGCCSGRRHPDSPAARRFRGFTAMALVFALIGTALGCWDNPIASWPPRGCVSTGSGCPTWPCRWG